MKTITAAGHEGVQLVDLHAAGNINYTIGMLILLPQL
jgi:hypothetical protein